MLKFIFQGCSCKGAIKCHHHSRHLCCLQSFCTLGCDAVRCNFCFIIYSLLRAHAWRQFYNRKDNDVPQIKFRIHSFPWSLQQAYIISFQNFGSWIVCACVRACMRVCMRVWTMQIVLKQLQINESICIIINRISTYKQSMNGAI